jgi:hypothetical protein
MVQVRRQTIDTMMTARNSITASRPSSATLRPTDPVKEDNFTANLI